MAFRLGCRKYRFKSMQPQIVRYFGLDSADFFRPLQGLKLIKTHKAKG